MEIRKYFEFVKSDFDAIKSFYIKSELQSKVWDNFKIKKEIREQRDYSILTAEITKATFGMTPSEYKNLKDLKSQNLRDHMTDLELIFSMLGEASTKEIVVNTNPKGFTENNQKRNVGLIHKKIENTKLKIGYVF